MGSPISRVPLSAILSATSTSPNLLNLPFREVLITTTEQTVTTFTIDISILNLFYVAHESVFSVSSISNQSREFMLGPGNIPLNFISSYRDFAFSYLTQFFVVTQMVLPIADTFNNQDISEFSDLGFVPTANAMFRRSIQPLPSKLVAL